MSLEIRISEGSTIKMDVFSFNKGENRLSLSKSNVTEVSLSVNVPFSLKKTRDVLFDANQDISQIIVLTNRYFAQTTLVKLKHNVDGENKTVGFIFSLRGILESENVIEDNPEVAAYAVRALVSLLHNHTSLAAHTPTYDPGHEYSLLDFYDEDIILCAISKQQIKVYSKETELSVLYKLNLFGFYLTNYLGNEKFYPELNTYQQNALSSILNLQNAGSISFELLKEKILKEPYFETYIRSLINRIESYITKFFIIYQCYEILIDFITKSEIIAKVCGEGAIEDKSGFQIKELVGKIGSEGYRMEKLFTHYSSFPFDSDYQVGAEILIFFDKYRPKYEIKQSQTAGSYFYEFRNTLVHNLRILFSENVVNKESDLRTIINSLEFLTIETIIGLKE